ncbi:O-methyltransferase [Saccharicrinis sp. FJH62]|uniref:O-methyltransferase n=1 Tax=Saccharicrinis sp. FJH62 TaxID=3344657 RepID=UPI0035D4F6C5
MGNTSFRIRSFIIHLITAIRNNKGFGVQSPFAYNLLKEAIHGDHSFYSFLDLRKEKNRMLRIKREIEVEDFGAGGYSRYLCPVCEVVFKSVKSTGQQEMLFRLVNHMKSSTILELGTSLGLTTAYLASANPKAQVVTIEACHACAKEAADLWKKLNLTNITLIEDTFDNKLLPALKLLKNVDFVFIDGNHTGEALERYFEQILPYCTENCMVVADDIYWSHDMYDSWLRIKGHSSVRVSFNLFHMGIMVLNSEVTPGHYKAIVL